MNSGWLPAIVTAVLNALYLVWFYGGQSRELKEHGKRLDGQDKKIERHDGRITDLRVDLGRVKTKVGLNGEWNHGD